MFYLLVFDRIGLMRHWLWRDALHAAEIVILLGAWIFSFIAYRAEMKIRKANRLRYPESVLTR